MKKNLFFIILGVVSFSLLAFLISHFSGVWLGVEIIVLFALFLMVGMTRTERLDGDPSSPTQDKPESPDSTSSATTPSSNNWGGIIAGVVTVALLIGVLFFWAPWKSGNNIPPAISEADREMMAQGWQKIAVTDVGGGYYSFEIPEGLTPGHKIKFQSVLWEKQRLSSGKEIDTCRGEWCTNYFFPAGVSVKDTPLYLKTKNPPNKFEWVKIQPLKRR